MTNDKQKRLTSLKKARSLLDTIINMVEEDKYCIDIMQQNLAAIGLLRSTHHALMENHINHCFTEALNSKDESRKQEMIQEILSVSNLYNK